MEFQGTKEEIIKKSKDFVGEEITLFIEKAMETKISDSYLIAVLHKLQDQDGYLKEDKLKAVAYLMNIPTAKITGVATFYHYFKLKKSAKYQIEVCLGTACHVKGVDRVTSRLKEELGIDFNESTKDNKFSLHMARCLGMCALAPVIKINDDIYQNVSPDQISKILKKYS